MLGGCLMGGEGCVNRCRALVEEKRLARGLQEVYMGASFPRSTLVLVDLALASNILTLALQV